ncbi:MAG TPA: hypothetical protein VK472_07005 [Allosphingosinicella sp.]|nr:hypothetical protein [Allosphingosinicella sp.]
MLLLPTALILGVCAYIDHQDRQGPWLPAKLELSDSYRREGQDDVLSYCGTSVYGLRAATVQAIRRNGLVYFKGAERPRDPEIPRVYIWSESPIPNERGVPPLECAPDIDADLGRAVRQALKMPGSYWARSGDHALYVVPDMGIVISSHRD